MASESRILSFEVVVIVLIVSILTASEFRISISKVVGIVIPLRRERVSKTIFNLLDL